MNVISTHPVENVEDFIDLQKLEGTAGAPAFFFGLPVVDVTFIL